MDDNQRLFACTVDVNDIDGSVKITFPFLNTVLKCKLTEEDMNNYNRQLETIDYKKLSEIESDCEMLLFPNIERFKQKEK